MSQAMNMMTDMAVQSVRQNNLDTQRSRLANIENSKDESLKERELRKAAEGFEAIFIQKMWDEMRSSLPKNGIHYSKEEEYWQSMYSQELGKSMASAGGIGLADMMVEQLTKPAVASPQTGALSRIRMAVEPAPLVPQENLQTKQNAAQEHGALQTAQKAAPNSGRQTSRQAVSPDFYEECSPEHSAVQAAAADKAFQAQNAADERTNAASAQNQNEHQTQKAQQEPQIIRTTYITNLPPEKREHAILDRKGNPVKKTERTAAPEPIKTPTRNDYFDRSQSIARTIKAESTAQPAQQIRQAQPESPARQNADSALPKQAYGEPQDILAGITTTYIPYHQRMAMIQASQIQAQPAPAETAAETFPKTDVQTAKRSFRLPSLEEALNMGTLVASLTDSEPTNIHGKTSGQAMQTQMPQTIGGGTILTDPPQMPQVSAVAPKSEYQMPVQGTIRSAFGWRIDPINRQRAWHTGIDIEVPAGSAVSAAGAGTISFAGYDEQLGNVVIIDHGRGMQSVYGHNEKLLVNTGDAVSSGTQIAKTGSSGRTNGSHLHFEIRQNGLSINPEPFFAAEEIS